MHAYTHTREMRGRVEHFIINKKTHVKAHVEARAQTNARHVHTYLGDGIC